MPSKSSGRRTALYRFFGTKDRLLYVGVTERFGERWDRHMSTKPWWSEVKRQTAEWYETRDEAEAAEVVAIRTERPRYNIVHAVAERVEIQVPKFLILSIDTGQAAHDEGRLKVAVNGEAARARDLLDDLDQVLGTERARLSELPHLLRGLAPRWEPYRGLTGLQLAATLKDAGVRVTNTGNVPRLDPSDFRRSR